MKKFLTTLVLGVACSTAAAQSCFETNFGTPIGGGDDTVLPIQSIGFAFPFAGSTYTDIHISTNGFFYLSNAGVPAPGGANCCTGTTALLVSGSPKICPFWTDLNVIVANGANVHVNSSAAACVITWDNVVEFGNTVQFDLQCQIYPSGEIRFTFGGNMTLRTSGDALVGMSPGNAAPVPAASNWSVPGVTGDTTAFELFNNTALPFDLAGQSLVLTAAGTIFVHANSNCLASTSSYGAGCVQIYDSFYELFGTAAAFDLGNSAMRIVNTGTGYFAIPSPNAYVAPSAAATSLTLLDDSETTVALSTPMPVAGTTTSALTVCSNGFVSVATGNGTAFGPTAAGLLNGPQTSWRSWHDYNPTIAGSGQVKFEEVAGVAYVTWDGVFDFGTTGPGSTFQFQFDLASGNCDIVWGSISGAGNAHLVGFSVGGPSNDPGSIDLTTAVPLGTVLVSNTQITPLALAAAGLPALGSTVSLDSSNIPTNTPFGAVLFGFQKFANGVDLTGIGMPGCRQYNEGASTVIYVSPVGTASTPFVVPNDVGFLGIAVLAQAVTYSPGLTPLGAISSNGIEMFVGL